MARTCSRDTQSRRCGSPVSSDWRWLFGRRVCADSPPWEVKMGKAVRLFVEIFSISLRRSMAYRANLLFQIGMSVVGVAASLATLGVVFSKTASLAGWSLADSMVLLGTFEAVS